jgi:hypothetical protein
MRPVLVHTAARAFDKSDKPITQLQIVPRVQGGNYLCAVCNGLIQLCDIESLAPAHTLSGHSVRAVTHDPAEGGRVLCVLTKPKVLTARRDHIQFIYRRGSSAHVYRELL